MKKIKSLFLALLAMMLAVPSLHAQGNYIIGAPVALEDELDGLEVVFEGYSDDSNLGGYLGNLSDENNLPEVDTLMLTRFEGAIPQEIVWVIEELDSVSTRSDCVGCKLYNLRNKQTGKYIATDWTKDNHHNAIFMVADKSRAAAFQFHYSSEGGTFGSDANNPSFGDKSWPTNMSAMTICDAYIDPSLGRTSNRGFVCNEANEKIKGFHSWTDTNVWIMHRYWAPSTGKDFLNEFLNDLPSNWDGTGATSGANGGIYRAGTEPGFVGDSAKFQRFSDLVYKANEQIGSMSEEECQAVYEELTELYAWLQSDASFVPLEDGGYYYIFTANDAFVGMENGNFAMYAPKFNEPNLIGWKAFDENDARFIWQIKPAEVTESGQVRYSVQNMGSGLYMGQAQSKADSQPVQWTTEFTYPTVLININHAGHWYVSSARDWDEYPPRPFHQENHQNGQGVEGKIVLYNGSAGSASDWFIKKVPQDKVDMLASMQSRIELTNFWAQNSNLASGVDTTANELGFISSKEILDNYKKTVADVDTMLNYPQKEYTVEEYTAALEAFKSAVEAYNADRYRAIPDGYYRIRVQQAIYKYNDSAMYVNIVNDRPGWSRVYNGEFTTNHIWKITHKEGTKYDVQNMGNGKYISKGDNPNNSAMANFSDAAEVAQVIEPFEAMNGQFYISNEVDTLEYYDTGDHNNGTNSESVLKYWSDRAVDGGTAWVLEPVSEEEYNAIVAANDQNNLNYELRDVLTDAKRLYNQNTTYTYGDKLITTVEQIYCNNYSPAEGSNFNNLIDGTNGTYCNTSWDSEQNPDQTPYYRFMVNEAEGLPDSVILYSEERNDATWHRSPSKMRVSVSNDASEWTYLPSILEKPDITMRDLGTHSTDPVYVLIGGIEGYKYIRFEYLACQPNYQFNNHPVVEFSELNIMPVTGVDPASLTQSASYKNIGIDLFNAIQQGQTEMVASKATQATIDLINQAITNFNSRSTADSIVSMAKLNIQNLTDGEEIGDFPTAELETYCNEAQAAVDKFEAIGDENVSGSDITTVIKELKDAYDKLYPSMVKPEEGKWYILQLCDMETPDRLNNVMVAGGYYAHTPNTGGYSYWLTDQTVENAYADELAHFVFKANEDGTFTIQNVGTGFYNGPETGSGNGTYDYRPIQWYEPDSINIIPFGSGQIGLRLQSGRYFYQNPAWLNYGMTYETHDGTKGMDSKYAWLIQPSEDLDVIEQPDSMEAGRVIAITKPYELSGIPTSDEATIRGYKVVGKQTAEASADSIVTAYLLQELDPDAPIAAGTPVVYYADVNGDGNTPYNEEQMVHFTFSAVLNSEVTNENDTVNGLAACLDQISTPVAHYGYFLEDSVVDEPANTTIGAQRAVLIPWLVENLADIDVNVKVDKIIYVKGNGMLNDIKDVVIEDPKEIVDVYSVDGVLIRRNVARINATNGLAKGIYIVGKQKVLVK